MADTQVKDLATEFTQVAGDDWFLMQRKSDNKTGKVKQSVAFGGSWADVGSVPNSITYLGNNSVQLVFNSVDVTDELYPSARLRSQRSNTAPTQCTSLNGTTQYWSKTSPNKLTYTDDFCIYFHGKITSYVAQTIVSRWDGTNGWQLFINANGQLGLFGYNGGAGNYSGVVTNFAVPLNKFFSGFIQLDMSSFTASPTTSYALINGQDVPVTVQRAGTNPTALNQGTGAMQWGALNGAQFYAGKLAQGGIFNAKVTQSTARTYMSQGLSGSETSLASGYSFNGVATDLNTTTPNDLSAVASAGYVTDSPFANGTGGTYDYGIVQSSSYSTNTTVIVQMAEANSIPTSGGVTAIGYSGLGKPYGFPSAPDKWRLETIAIMQYSLAATGAWQNNNSFQIYAPVGEWWAGYDGMYQANITATAADTYITLSTGSTTESSKRFSRSSTMGTTGASVSPNVQGMLRKPLSVSTAAAYYLNQKAASGTLYIRGDNCECVIFLENAYL